ncbi:MAG: hypothetical protein WCT16_02965 [Candidatus Buchananbacteria bacterium]
MMEKIFDLFRQLFELVLNSLAPLTVLVLILTVAYFLFRYCVRTIKNVYFRRQEAIRSAALAETAQSVLAEISAPDQPLPEPPREYVYYLKLAERNDLANQVFPCGFCYGRYQLDPKNPDAMGEQLGIGSGEVFYFNRPDMERTGLEAHQYESRVADLNLILNFLGNITGEVNERQAIFPKDDSVTLKNPTRAMFKSSRTIKAGTLLEIIIEEGEYYLVRVVKSPPNFENDNGAMFFVEKSQWENWRQLFAGLLSAAEKSRDKYLGYLPEVYAIVDQEMAYIEGLLAKAEARQAETETVTVASVEGLKAEG